MKKRSGLITALFMLLNMVVMGGKAEETTDIRKYHQQLEERVFETENQEEKDEKIKESFFHGKRRIRDAKKNEEARLEEKNKETSKKLEDIKIMETKYNIVLKEAEELIKEKERLQKENEELEKKLAKNTKGGKVAK